MRGLIFPVAEPVEVPRPIPIVGVSPSIPNVDMELGGVGVALRAVPMVAAVDSVKVAEDEEAEEIADPDKGGWWLL